MIFDFAKNETADDWLKAGRLSVKAANGDKDAIKELERMEKSNLEPIEDE